MYLLYIIRVCGLWRVCQLSLWLWIRGKQRDALSSVSPPSFPLLCFCFLLSTPFPPAICTLPISLVSSLCFLYFFCYKSFAREQTHAYFISPFLQEVWHTTHIHVSCANISGNYFISVNRWHSSFSIYIVKQYSTVWLQIYIYEHVSCFQYIFLQL